MQTSVDYRPSSIRRAFIPPGASPGAFQRAALLVFFNLCAAYYALARWFFLRETGRKLTHMDRQLIASEGVHEDLPPELWSTRG